MATSMASNSYARGDRRGLQQRQTGRTNYSNSRSNMRRSNANQNYSHPSPPPLHHQQQNPEQTGAGEADQGSPNVYKNEACVRAITQMFGRPVILTSANGAKYEGIVAGISDKMDITLKEVRRVSTADSQPCDREQTTCLIFGSQDIQTVVAANIDLGEEMRKERSGEFQTDTAISRTNGTDGREAGMKPLVEWNADGDASDMTDISLGDQGMGWNAEEMFHTNMTKYSVKTTYDNKMDMYTSPMPKFNTVEEQREAERRAEQAAREIENSEGYRHRASLENNTEIDEEAKYSAVVRTQEPPSSSSSRAYVPPGRRHQQQQHYQDGHNASMGPRGPAPGAPTPHQPLPQRERRMDRERCSDRNHHDQRGGGGGDHDKMPIRTPPLRNPPPSGPPPPQPHIPLLAAQQSKDTSDRLSAGRRGGGKKKALRELAVSTDRRSDGHGRGGYAGRQGHQQDGPAPSHHHHGGHPLSQHPISQAPNHSSLPPAPQPPPTHHPNYNHVPLQAPQGPNAPPPPPASVVAPPPSQGPPPPRAHLPPSSLPSLAQLQVGPGRANPPPQPTPPPPTPTQSASQHATSPVMAASQNVMSSSSPAVEAPTEAAANSPPAASSHAQQQQQSVAVSTANAASSTTGSEKMSPRDKDPQVKQLKQFHHDFKVQFSDQMAEPETRCPQEKGVEGEPMMQGAEAATVTSRGASTNSAVVTEPAIPKTSTLNPNATEFKPRTQHPPVMQIPSPAPPGTPPSQGPRQSPGVMGQQTLIYPYMPKIMPMAANQPQPPSKSFQNPKRAVVSVDPVALAQSATGQPLTIGPQAAASMQQSYVYVPNTVLNQQYHPHHMSMRVVQSIPQAAGMDPTMGSGQQPHPMQQQYIMAQQPVPAHMSNQALTQSMPQPAHTHTLHQHQHLQQHAHQMPPHQSSMPPASQSNVGVNPLPSASPVQHIPGGNGHGHSHGHSHGPPQMNHSQGAPPTSNAHQFGGHQMAGILPPQGAAGHAVPAHTGAQGPATALQFLSPGQLQGAVSFSQAGATGPAPAHLQQSGHPVSQTQHVVVMPHPPAQAINQAPLNNPPHHQQHHQPHQHHQQHQHQQHQQQQQQQHQHQQHQQHQHHQHHQHAAAAAHFQQHLQGAGNQLHGQMGPSQHLLQGNVPTAGSGMGMPHTMHPYGVPQAVGYRPSGISQPSQRGAHHRRARGAQSRSLPRSMNN